MSKYIKLEIKNIRKNKIVWLLPSLKNTKCMIQSHRYPFCALLYLSLSLSSLKSNYRVSNPTKAFTLKIFLQKEERLRAETAICYQYHFCRSRSEGTSSISFKREPLLKKHHFTAITFTDWTYSSLTETQLVSKLCQLR